MRPLKMLGLAALAALMAMAFVGAGSAMAESTALCSKDPGEAACPEGSVVSHLHEATLSGAKATLVTNSITVECDVLFLAEVLSALGEPLLASGNLTYTNCGSCTVAEVSEETTVEFAKLGHETADVAGEGEVSVKCGAISCTYNATELLGTAKGPLLSSEKNGSRSIVEQSPSGAGLFCPSAKKLNISLTPLSATSITK